MAEQSFLDALKHRLLWEGRQRQMADERGEARKPLSDQELVDLVFQDLGWDEN